MIDFQYFATFTSIAQVRSLFNSHSSSPKSATKSPWKIPIFLFFSQLKVLLSGIENPHQTLFIFLSQSLFFFHLFFLFFRLVFLLCFQTQPPSFVLLYSCLHKSPLVTQSSPFSVPYGRPKQPTHQSSLANPNGSSSGWLEKKMGPYSRSGLQISLSSVELTSVRNMNTRVKRKCE